ncbi:hypothetical protein J3Q09_03880 [Pseudomonas sp. R4-83]|jgi:hypothetical protein|uniref:hypothetical protein n=1 Tax=Pseudomonas TaxID=286 RepID=UPI00300EE22C
MPIVSLHVEDALKHIAELGEPPCDGKRSSDEDEQLTATVKDRLAAPEREKVILAEL